MKSKIFSMIDLVSVKRDCVSLLKVPAEKVFPIFVELHQIHDDEARTKRAAAAASELHVDASALIPALNLLRFIARRLIDSGFSDDSPQNIAIDIVQSAAIENVPDNQISSLTSLIQEIKNYCAKERSEFRALQFKADLIPTLEELEILVDIRPIFDRSNVECEESYSPKLLGAVPIVLVKIQTSANSNDEVVFQLTEEKIVEIIGKLRNIQKELEISKTGFRLQNK